MSRPEKRDEGIQAEIISRLGWRGYPEFGWQAMIPTPNVPTPKFSARRGVADMSFEGLHWISAGIGFISGIDAIGSPS